MAQRRKVQVGDTKIRRDGREWVYTENGGWALKNKDQDYGEMHADVKGVTGDFSSGATGGDFEDVDISEMYETWGEGFSEGERVAREDYEDFAASSKEYIEEQADILQEMIDNDATGEELAQFAHDLASSKEYQDIVHTKEEARAQYYDLSDEYSDLNTSLSSYIDEGYADFPVPGTRGKKTRSFSQEDAEAMYEKCQDAVENYEQYRAFSDLSEDYKNTIANALGQAQKQHDTSDVFTEFTGDRIGDMVSIGEVVPGSREWHELRQTGMGGSDVGAIVSRSKHYLFNEDGQPALDDQGKQKFKTYDSHTNNMREMWAKKMGEIDEEDIADQTDMIAHDAATRGHVLEDVVAEMAARKHGLHLMHNKGTWSRPGSNVNINFDFMMTSDGKTPDGNFEIKTATNPRFWGDESLGIDGVPAAYRAQVLAGCHEAGFDRGAIAVLINEKDLKVYQFDMTDELREEAAKNAKEVNEVYDNIKAARDAGRTEFDRDAFGLRYYGGGGNKFSSTLLNVPKRGDLRSKPRMKQFRDIARLRGMDTSNPASQKQVAEEFESYIASRTSRGEEITGEMIRDGLEHLYVKSAKPLRDRGVLAGIDLECNAITATQGRIIESGVSGVDMRTGQETGKTVEQLYSLPKMALDYGGTGAEHVHHISPKDIAGKPRMDKAEGQRIIDAIMDNGGTVLAHNASYEKQFLRGHVPGFAEAERTGKITFIDSMPIAGQTMQDAPNRKLASFAEYNGVNYEGAHRAKQDTDMMLKAMYNYFDGNFGGNARMQEEAKRLGI